jgi:hypothetical protein
MGNKSKLTEVRETNLGVYVWQLQDGSFLSDDDLNILSITAMRGDLRAMANITATAKYLGFGDGHPVFAEGRRKIDQEEWEYQQERSRNGYIPDPYDIGIFKEGLKKKK